jgi:hypothetical protein
MGFVVRALVDWLGFGEGLCIWQWQVQAQALFV